MDGIYGFSDVTLIHGDCLERMKEIPDGSVDLILTDPPYGTTACKWDNVIPFEPMWKGIWRVLKPNGACVLFGVEPFSSALRLSDVKAYRYDWIWNKIKAANFLFGNRQPLKKTELISVFYRKQPTYLPIKTINPNGRQKSGRKGFGNLAFELLPNAPLQSKPGRDYEADKLLPDNLLEFSKPAKPVHPTQKPVALLEYLIKTYTHEGETVLDFTMGSGSTGVACVNTGRNFIGIEKDAGYCWVALERIEKAAAPRDEVSALHPTPAQAQAPVLCALPLDSPYSVEWF